MIVDQYGKRFYVERETTGKRQFAAEMTNPSPPFLCIGRGESSEAAIDDCIDRYRARTAERARPEGWMNT